ncbi:SDR family NAD(P)-dependent oxidoreductase [Actinomadura vinacea]|uniref:SDR family NAD(P)-dependent oxidoreductase n=1 Tax=Actinomadura vinacea TaxID=115336 RepID=A0ABN3IS21_9ACTN
MTDNSFTGKNALVTGGTRGIGRAVALALAGAGANVAVCYRADAEAAAKLEAELAGTPGKHLVLQADIADAAQVRTLLDEVGGRFGGLDVVVHNAGLISHVPIDDLEPAEWHRILDSNLTGMYLVARASLALLRDGGSIVGIGSKVALVGISQRTHYTAAKAGLIGFVRSLSKELGPRGIRVNLVAPGITETDQAAHLPPEQRERYQTMTALKRLGQADEVADVVLFLAGPQSRYVTGETINVDGGM